VIPRPVAGSVPGALPLAVGALCAVAGLLAPAAGVAHPVTSRTENNRYVKLTLAEGRLRVAYSVLYGELPSFYARRAMDRDGDGRVSADEARAHADEVATQMAAQSVLTVNGTRIPLRLPDRAATVADPRVGPIPFSIDLWEVVAVAPRGRMVIAFEAGGELPRLGETEVKFEESPGARLVAWCRNRPPCTTRVEEPRIVWMGPRASSMEDRTVSAVYEVLAAGRRRARVTALVGGGVLLVAAAATLVLLRRRRRAS
jgi:hypothetical protein